MRTDERAVSLRRREESPYRCQSSWQMSLKISPIIIHLSLSRANLITTITQDQSQLAIITWRSLRRSRMFVDLRLFDFRLPTELIRQLLQTIRSLAVYVDTCPRAAEHRHNRPEINLWLDHLVYLAFPFSIYLVRTSTCNQSPSFLQIAAISNRGSKAPSTVVPQVAFTKNGKWDCFFASAMALFRSLGSIRPNASVLICHRRIEELSLLFAQSVRNSNWNVRAQKRQWAVKLQTVSVSITIDDYSYSSRKIDFLELFFSLVQSQSSITMDDSSYSSRKTDFLDLFFSLALLLTWVF